MRNCLDFQIEDVLLTIHAALNDLQHISSLFLRMRKLLFAQQSMSKSLLLTEALEKTVDKVCETLECDRASVFMLDELNGELWSRIAKGSDKTIRIPLGKGIVGAVVSTETRENIEDVYFDSRFNKENDRNTGYRTKSLLCVPIRDQTQHVLGATQAINKLSGGRFTLDDECLFEWFTANAGIILRNSMRFDESILNQHRTRQLILSVAKLHDEHEVNRFVAKAE